MSLPQLSFFRRETLYALRYAIGYSLLLVFLLLIVTVDIDSLPKGISLAGMDTVVTSMSIQPTVAGEWIINAPYHLLQYASISLFGLARLPVVLPSLLFGTLTMIVFFLTMKQWFRDSVAVVTTLVAMTTGPFITMTRSATPDIMLPFWTIVLLYAAVMVLVRHDKAFLWKVIAVTAVLGLLYTPFGIYPLIAFAIAGYAHPHVRSRLRHMNIQHKLVLVTIIIIGSVPLILHIIVHPASLGTLLGIPIFRASLGDIHTTLRAIFVSYVNVTHSSFVGTNITPMFSIVSLILMLLGLFRCIRDWHTTRSYVLISWLLVSIPIIVLAPEAQQVVLMPAMLLLAIGTETLILQWYALFPRNPYARVAGLVPLTILFVTIAFTNTTHYFDNHRYITNPAYRISLSSIQDVARTHRDTPLLLVTDEPTVAFYSLLTKQYPKLTVRSTPPNTVTQLTMVTPEAPVETGMLGTPSNIITSPRSTHSVTLRVYTPPVVY